MRLDQRARGGDPIGGHDDGDAGAREQQRLVADLARIRIGSDDDRRAARARSAVAAAHDARMPAALGERTRERGSERRLAAAADGDVADDDYRDRQPPRVQHAPGGKARGAREASAANAAANGTSGAVSDVKR